MQRVFDTVIRISSERSEIVVEQEHAGITSRKTLSPKSLARCILESRYDESEHFSGLLPDYCLSVTLSANGTWYFIRYPDLYADISYYGTEYEHFPFPRLVFAFKHTPENGKITGSRLCVVKDERLSMDTPTFHYPFSNVYAGGSICLGNNALPAYKNPTRIFTLANFILRLPNNNDNFRQSNNKLKLGYRDLLEHLKDKQPEYYYSDVLIPDGRTLKDFITGR